MDNIEAFAGRHDLSLEQARSFIGLCLAGQAAEQVIVLNDEMKKLLNFVEAFSSRHADALRESYRAVHAALDALADHVDFIAAFPNEWPVCDQHDVPGRTGLVDEALKFLQLHPEIVDAGDADAS